MLEQLQQLWDQVVCKKCILQLRLFVLLTTEKKHVIFNCLLTGAGKTSFLYTLCGKAKSYGNISGNIYINDEIKQIYDMNDIVGFVPQNDIMTSYRRVEEVLNFNAKFRLENNTPNGITKQIVKDVMQLLGINHIRNTIIGDETRRGISGGQKKRVNIGMELVAHPSMLFLGVFQFSFIHKMLYILHIFFALVYVYFQMNQRLGWIQKPVMML